MLEYVTKTLRKAIMRRSIYKLTILRKEHLNHEKIIRNKRTTVVSYIKKSARRFLAT